MTDQSVIFILSKYTYHFMNMNQGAHSSEIWVSATRPNYLFSPSYPDVRFSCQQCGSLDVFMQIGNEKSIMKCLDCDSMEKIT